MKKCVICNNNLQGNQTKFCSNSCKQKDHWHRIKNQQNTYHSQTKRGLKRKLKFVNLLGGKCKQCGYNKNLSALEFNHLNCNEKEFSLDIRKMSNTNEKKLLKEILKCELLCANCHREHHYKEMDLNNVKKILDL